MNSARPTTTAPSSLSDRDFNRLGAFIESVCGIKMEQKKRAMLESRLLKRLRTTGLPSLSDYVDYLFSPEGQTNERVHMIDAVTTNKTDFFRESAHFDILCDTVLPDLLENRAGSRNVLVWSAGCSTGEEPYTLAMVLSEYRETRADFNFSILATDICTRVLDTAQQGVYHEENVEPVPMEIRHKYLLKSKDHSSGLVKMSPELRSKIEFRKLNLMDDYFGIQEPVDAIFCRNVIIYFDRPTQKRLLSKFSEHLRPGGYLFLGHSESMSGHDLPLIPMAPTVYQKRLEA